MIEKAGEIAAAIDGPGGITVLLVLCILALAGALVYVAKQFKNTSDAFINSLEKQTNAFKEQLAVCETRCEENSAHFFSLLNSLLMQFNTKR